MFQRLPGTLRRELTAFLSSANQFLAQVTNPQVFVNASSTHEKGGSSELRAKRYPVFSTWENLEETSQGENRMSLEKLPRFEVLLFKSIK
jgi:hypothetical protein